MSSRRFLVAPLLVALAVPARAADPRPAALTRAPAVIAPATPEYPPAARARHLSGEVVLELDLSETGTVLAARVVRPAGEGFDEAALAAARTLRFSPAEIDGAAAAVTLEYRFRFDSPPPAPDPVLASTDSAVLRRSAGDLYEVVVTGERERKEVTSVTLTSGEVGRVAGVSGDAVKVVQNLPGVARAPGGFGTLVVRGGNPSDTRVYVDGVEVPLVFHFGGLTSIVPSELIESVDFEAGNFGVRHGRATGGRVDLRTRDPDTRQLHLLADGNLFHALTLAEGPAGEDVSFAVAVRRSYADAIVTRAAKGMDGLGVTDAPRYYDYQGKLTWRAGKDDTVRLSVLGSDDRMLFTGVPTGGLRDLDQLGLHTAFVQATGSWEHRLGGGARARLAVAQGYVEISNVFGSSGAERERLHVTSARAEASQDLGARLTLAAGADTRFMPSGRIEVEFPEIPPPNQLPDPDPRKIRALYRLQAMEAGLWTEATWRPVDGLAIVPGLRVEREAYVERMTWVDPRLSARWTVGDGTTLKGGAGLYHQPPAAVYLTREWGNPGLHEEGAWHFMTGIEQRVAGPVAADLQLYYKRLFDLVLPVEGPERYSNGGTGRSYGAELLLRWNPGGRFFGWISYSLSRSTRDQAVVGGRLEPGGDAYDQPHHLVALGTLDLPELWNGFSVGFRARYATGNPYARTVGAVFDADADRYQAVEDPSSRARMPEFFQLDLRADKRWTWRTWMLSLYLEVDNATNRKNAEGVAYNYDYTQRGWSTGLPLYPSFGIRAEY
jgi:TonB family protein